MRDDSAIEVSASAITSSRVGAVSAVSTTHGKLAIEACDSPSTSILPLGGCHRCPRLDPMRGYGRGCLAVVAACRTAAARWGPQPAL